MVALNVRALSRRLSPLLSWPFHLYCLSEVRVSAASQKTLEKVAARSKVSCVWSFPPAPSPTFSVSPGGTVIMARKPLVARPVKIPSLRRWITCARLSLACVMSPGAPHLIVASVYGYPEGHDQRGLNDEMLRDIFVELASWTSPVLISGDFNTSVGGSRVLGLANSWGFERMSDDRPTTMSKKGIPKEGAPIDHLYANVCASDLIHGCFTNHDITMSDHYPIQCRLTLPQMGLLEVRWPELVPSLPPTRADTDFPLLPGNVSFDEWQRCAVNWIQEAFCIKGPSQRQDTSPALCTKET